MAPKTNTGKGSFVNKGKGYGKAMWVDGDGMLWVHALEQPAAAATAAAEPDAQDEEMILLEGGLPDFLQSSILYDLLMQCDCWMDGNSRSCHKRAFFHLEDIYRCMVELNHTQQAAGDNFLFCVQELSLIHI